mmetsp:Transcript_28419/g.85714  ORF Transcript_28419/g.85714 Transcript_28419/m.85714 type:complete len:240 (-) Transcript_28419:3029-3748(-)
MSLQPQREVRLALVRRQRHPFLQGRVRLRARGRDVDVEVGLVLDGLAGQERRTHEDLLLGLQDPVRRVHGKHAHVLLQRLRVDDPFDGVVVRIVQRELLQGGHGLDARGDDLGLEVHARGAEQHAGPQGLRVHELPQSLALVAARRNDRELERVVVEVVGLVRELHRQGEIRLDRDLVQLRIGLFVLILRIAAFDRRVVAAVGGTTDRELVLLHGEGLQRGGIELAILLAALRSVLEQT